MASFISGSIKTLSDLLQTLSELFHVRISLLDKSFLDNRKTFDRPGNYCSLVCDNPNMKESCFQHEEAAFEETLNSNQAVHHSCQGGLHHILFPLVDHEEMHGIIYLSEMRILTAPPAAVLFLWNENKGNKEELRKSFLRIPYFREYDIKNLLRLLTDTKNLFFASRPVNAAQPNDVDDVVEYMRHHYEKHLTLTDAAAMINRSISRTSHLFLEKYGKGFKEIQAGILIERTHEIIDQQYNISIKDLALKLGFNDSIYFSKFYKKQTGSTLSQYKKELKGL